MQCFLVNGVTMDDAAACAIVKENNEQSINRNNEAMYTDASRTLCTSEGLLKAHTTPKKKMKETFPGRNQYLCARGTILL